MSLINDALRRASQSEKSRPRPAPTPLGMEPAPAARGSRLTVVLALVVLATLLLAGWFFWQWWIARNNNGSTVVAASIALPVTPHVIPPPAVAPKPLGVPPSGGSSRVIPPPVVTPKPAPIAPAAPTNPAPAPVAVLAPPVVAPPAAAPVVPPTAARDTPIAWPVELKLNAIFYSKTNPRAVINGNLYGVGDEIQGVVLKKIEKDKVTAEWNGHSKILMMGGQ